MIHRKEKKYFTPNRLWRRSTSCFWRRATSCAEGHSSMCGMVSGLASGLIASISRYSSRWYFSTICCVSSLSRSAAARATESDWLYLQAPLWRAMSDKEREECCSADFLFVIFFRLFPRVVLCQDHFVRPTPYNGILYAKIGISILFDPTRRPAILFDFFDFLFDFATFFCSTWAVRHFLFDLSAPGSTSR